MALLAEIGGVHVAGGSSKSVARVHPKAWNPLSILRSAFTPVTPLAYSTVMEVGKTTARDNRAVVAEIIKKKQSEAMQSSAEEPVQSRTKLCEAVQRKVDQSSANQAKLCNEVQSKAVQSRAKLCKAMLGKS